MIYVRNGVEVQTEPAEQVTAGFLMKDGAPYLFTLHDPTTEDGVFDFCILEDGMVVYEGVCPGQTAYDAAGRVHDEYEKLVSENGSQ